MHRIHIRHTHDLLISAYDHYSYCLHIHVCFHGAFHRVQSGPANSPVTPTGAVESPKVWMSRFVVTSATCFIDQV